MEQINATPGGAREMLKDVLPLDTPYMIQMFPVYGCNFRCGFCLHALDRRRHGYISDVPFMDMALYRKCVDDIKGFGKKLKMLRFAAIGEPLLHREIAEMVAYAKKSEIAQSVDIVTNGSLLTAELSNRLIDAGLDRLRISVEGLSAEDYRRTTGTEIDFNRFVEQLRYFYNHSGQTRVYIKIIDYMVQEQERKEQFFALFQPICHSIAIEHLTPTIAEIDYNRLSGGMRTDKPQNGSVLLDAEVCPQGFYMMQINPDGKVVPCCSMKYPAVLGDARLQTVPEIWRGKTFNNFRLQMLRSREEAGAVCGACSLYRYDLHSEDMLDEVRKDLMEKYTAG